MVNGWNIVSNYIQEIAQAVGTYSKDYKPTESENSEHLSKGYDFVIDENVDTCLDTIRVEYPLIEAKNSEKLTRSLTIYPKTTATQLRVLFQPIETASKEARLILIDKDGCASVGYWSPEYQMWTDPHGEDFDLGEFLYWLPGDGLL